MQRLPDWLKIGALVDCGIFCGVVTDLATSERGVILVYVESMKEARRGPRGGEWLPYAEGQMKPATAERIQEDARYNDYAIRAAWNRMNAFYARLPRA